MKKSIIITLFLCLLLIGSVSAASDNDTSISSEDSISQNDNNVEISQTDNVKTTDDNSNKLESSETINKKSILKENNEESEIHKYYTTKKAKKENNLILDDGEAEEPLFIMDTEIYSKLNNKDSTLLEIYEDSYGIENGNISIYVNNESTPRKIYTIANYEFDNKEHYSEDMGYYLDVSLNDLNIIQYGVYSLKVIGKDERSENEINLLETEIIYSPVQVYIHHEFIDDDTLIRNFIAESFNGENGTLKFYVNNDTIPRITYDIINGKFSNGNDTKEITLNDLNIGYTYTNITAKFQLKNSDNEIELIKYIYIPDNEQLLLTHTVLTLKTNETIKKSDKTFTFEAQLRINGKVAKGKDIIFTINGMSYIARTNGTGIAKVILSSIGLQHIRESIPTDNKIKCKITFGDYVDIKYVNVESDTNNQPNTPTNPTNPDAGNNGNNNQNTNTPTNPTTGSSNTVSNDQSNKQTINLIATKKTFKSKVKVKKYAVTLKSGNKAINKATITLTIKGKKYKKTIKATTNNKGKTIFKIRKLTKKGKYTATIKYKGNKKYKAIKKTVKIIVK